MNPITENDIAQYLLLNPEFFERNAELLASVRLYSGLGGRATSLQERQAILLREKIKHHEQRIMEMIRYGNENVTNANRLHQWTCDILAVTELRRLPELVSAGLRAHFFLPQTALRLWPVKSEYQGEPFAGMVSDALKDFAQSMEAPLMGANSEPEILTWLEAPDQVRSVAIIPLKSNPHQGNAGECFGMLVFASPDSQRFTATMGTDFLERIAMLSAACLQRLTELDAIGAE